MLLSCCLILCKLVFSAACKSVSCPSQYHTCEVVNDQPACQCPRHCKKTNQKVCGITSGKAYENECELRKYECKRNIMIPFKHGPCKRKFFRNRPLENWWGWGKAGWGVVIKKKIKIKKHSRKYFKNYIIFLMAHPLILFNQHSVKLMCYAIHSVVLLGIDHKIFEGDSDWAVLCLDDVFSFACTMF